MNFPRLRTLWRWFRRMNLWPRLVIVTTLGFLLLFGIFGFLSLRAVNDSTDRILQERLVIAQMAAQEIDRLVERAFFELEKATEFAAFDPGRPVLNDEYHMLAHAYGRVGALSLGVYFLDAYGRVVLSEPVGDVPWGTDLSGEFHIRQVKETGRRSVSDPFVDPATGRPALALTIPVFGPDGALLSMLSGLIDVTSDEIMGPLTQARDMGHTGHSELVDSRGLIIASTDYGGFLKPGEHRDFYLRMFQEGGTGVENVPYIPWYTTPETDENEHHIMAFAPLTQAPWGVSVGGLASETFAPVTSLRNTILISGALSLALLWVLTLLGARLLVRPVRTLTGAARRMASGDLGQPIRVGEGGEISVLGESLESMRAQLRASMEQVRRWGEELEVEVAQRTSELATRNRQLAAVTAVATAANEATDLKGILDRCLKVTMEHTGMEAGAVRLLDEQGDHLDVVSIQGDFHAFPCRNQRVLPKECPCGYAASTGTSLFLGAGEPFRTPLACRAPQARALVALPLKSPKGILGLLYLSRSRGDPPGPEDRESLEAICSQIAVAIEKSRLLRELGQVEAQRELDRMKAEFISAVSHELRTPLGFIKGYATTLLRDDIAIDPAIRQEFLDIISEESNKLQRMIDELLDASRLQAGGLQVDRRAVPLGEFLESSLHKVSPGLRERGYILEAPLSHEEATVLIDPFRVEQVLLNLIDNAARYSDPGSRIGVETLIQDGQAVISVKDQGDGIRPPEVERIFEPFYRGESSRRRGASGTGLGLAICRGIIESHDGRLWVESVLGEGSTFRFTVALAARPADPGPNGEGVLGPTGAGEG